mmetsp:Transcript_10538/g.17683  ORF Transcript_10538/g.17683 Transcript_10538/m.17683 type:complete len:165 (+) Transcript_10538:898-1392(+)
MDRENSAVKVSQQKVQQKLNTILFEQYREKGNAFLKQKRFDQAMEFYDKCLKITRKATSLDNVAVYVNKVACLLGLDRFHSVVTESNDALRLIKNYQNRNDGKHSEEDKARITQMQLRLAARKGTALQKLGKVSEAIAEYQKGLKIDPKNPQLLKDLHMLQASF